MTHSSGALQCSFVGRYACLHACVYWRKHPKGGRGTRTHSPLEEPEVEGVDTVGIRGQGMHREKVGANEVVAVGLPIRGGVVAPGKGVAGEVPAEGAGTRIHQHQQRHMLCKALPHTAHRYLQAAGTSLGLGAIPCERWAT